MSNFIRRTKNPNTGEFEDAEWLDDYYGKHRYGVRFPGNPEVYHADYQEWEFEDEATNPTPTDSQIREILNVFWFNAQNEHVTEGRDDAVKMISALIADERRKAAREELDRMADDIEASDLTWGNRLTVMKFIEARLAALSGSRKEEEDE